MVDDANAFMPIHSLCPTLLSASLYPSGWGCMGVCGRMCVMQTVAGGVIFIIFRIIFLLLIIWSIVDLASLNQIVIPGDQVGVCEKVQ